METLFIFSIVNFISTTMLLKKRATNSNKESWSTKADNRSPCEENKHQAAPGYLLSASHTGTSGESYRFTVRSDVEQPFKEARKITQQKHAVFVTHREQLQVSASCL